MKWLTLNHKGQGLTEYGIILLLILGVGMGVYFGSGVKGDIGNMYENVEEDLDEILSNTYDTGVTSTKTGRTFHQTSLSYGGTKGYGTNNDLSIWWFINNSGYKEYKVGQDNNSGGNKDSSKGKNGMLQYVPKTVNGGKGNSYGTDDPKYSTTYFKASDGNIYQIQYYADNPKGTTLTQYTGDPASVTLVDTATFSGYTDGKFRYE